MNIPDNKTSRYGLTIIVPVYNETDNMEALERRLADFLPKAKIPACVLMVDDGSADSSLSRIKEICGRHPDFFYLAF